MNQPLVSLVVVCVPSINQNEVHLADACGFIGLFGAWHYLTFIQHLCYDPSHPNSRLNHALFFGKYNRWLEGLQLKGIWQGTNADLMPLYLEHILQTDIDLNRLSLQNQPPEPCLILLPLFYMFEEYFLTYETLTRINTLIMQFQSNIQSQRIAFLISEKGHYYTMFAQKLQQKPGTLDIIFSDSLNKGFNMESSPYLKVLTDALTGKKCFLYGYATELMQNFMIESNKFIAQYGLQNWEQPSVSAFQGMVFGQWNSIRKWLSDEVVKEVLKQRPDLRSWFEEKNLMKG